MAQLATEPKNSGHLCPVHNDRDRPTLTIACYRHVANPTLCTDTMPIGIVCMYIC